MSQNKKHFTASALVIFNRHVLLVFHKKLGVWLYPGGHVEDNETPDETVVREVKEETGLDVEVTGEKDDGLADRENDVSALYIPYAILCEMVGDHYHNDLIYLCKIKEQSPNNIVHNPKESDGIGFFSAEDIKGLALFPNFRRLLEKVLG